MNLDQRPMGLQQTSPAALDRRSGLEVMPAAPGRCASAGTARRRSVRGAALPGRRVHRPPRGRQRADQAPLPTGRIRSQLPSPIPGAGASRSPKPSVRCRAGAAGSDPRYRRQPAHLRFRTRLGGRVHPGRMAGGCRGQGLADTPVARYPIAADLPLAHGRDPAGGRRTAFRGLRPHSDGRPRTAGIRYVGARSHTRDTAFARKPSPRTRSLLTPRPPPPTPICVRCN